MNIAEEIRLSLGDDWLPNIYTTIRKSRTRAVSIDVPDRENLAQIQHTLLGVELKIGKRRFPCPDLSTARYMRIFGRLGCREFAVPYDISKISAAADQLETAWQQSLILFRDFAEARSERSIVQLRSRLIRTIRNEIVATGPGDAMPAFDRETRQRDRTI